MSAYDPDLSAEYVRRLEFAVSQLAAALQQHRTDMHSASGRPCGTCRTSAIALGLVGVEPFVDRSGMDRKAALTAAIAAHIDGRHMNYDRAVDAILTAERTGRIVLPEPEMKDRDQQISDLAEFFLVALGINEN